jgi:hypothetical protein
VRSILEAQTDHDWADDMSDNLLEKPWNEALPKPMPET